MNATRMKIKGFFKIILANPKPNPNAIPRKINLKKVFTNPPDFIFLFLKQRKLFQKGSIPIYIYPVTGKDKGLRG